MFAELYRDTIETIISKTQQAYDKRREFFLVNNGGPHALYCYAILHISFGRQSGRTTFLAKYTTDRCLVVVPNQRLKKHLLKLGVKNIKTYRELNEKTAEFDRIYIRSYSYFGHFKSEYMSKILEATFRAELKQRYIFME